MSALRLPQGGLIDRSRTLGFTFDGRALRGHPGDTLASALLANDVHLVGRSFKYHRPRGILSAGVEETNAIVSVGEEPRVDTNTRATTVDLQEGLVARSLHRWPSLRWDLGALSGALSGVLVAGFYYKTFMWPRSLWRSLYEPLIRALAGPGEAPRSRDPDRYDKMHVHCDVLIVGGGPAGLAAARAAASGDARVVLVEQQGELGGELLGSDAQLGGEPASQWLEETLAELRVRPEVTLLPRTTLFGYYDHNFLCAVERRGEPVRERLWHFRARQVILATGAHERPLVFGGNDLPGVMLAGAVLKYARCYGVAAGRRVVLFANHDAAYADAAALARAGVSVEAIVDPRREPGRGASQLAEQAGIRTDSASVITRAEGRGRVRGAQLARLSGGASSRIECDLIAMSGGYSPVVHLFSQSQGKLRWDEEKLCFVPGSAAQAVRCVGAANGTFGLHAALAEGHEAGCEAAGLEKMGSDPFSLGSDPIFSYGIEALWQVPARLARGKAFVDFEGDVTTGDVALAAREGFRSVEHFKRYTTTGMSSDQGKTSNVNALALLSAATGRTIPETGTTTFRAPYTPVSYGVLAGRDLGDFLEPVRVTPIHPWHEAKGAVFENVGQWKRPWFYPAMPGESMHQAVQREARAVRTSLGVLDASTLGKIDVQGRDAARFLDRIYTNTFSSLGIGRARYGLMCREDGMVFDDGVTTRLGEQHFWMTTTTGGAARVLDWLEEWLQTEWTDLEVYCTSITEQWATVAVAGPKARELLARVAPGMALDEEAFPFLSMREGRVAGLDACVFRISFTGELSYEINVPSCQGLALWEAVVQAGQEFGMTPYGTETMHLARAEKGFIIVGQETDGTVTPHDLGLGRMVAKGKDFLGKRSLERSDTRREDRKQLVGLLPAEPNEVLPEGAQITLEELPLPERHGGAPVPMVGHVTSSYFSPNLGRSFALALVKAGRSRLGTDIHVPLEGRAACARIVEPVFLHAS
jgi:sarcosine oxidase subunit alpha